MPDTANSGSSGGKALMRQTAMVLVLGVLGLGLLAGCWNEQVATTVRMGDVSVGQQLIDLQRALEAGAIDEEEHARLKSGLLDLSNLCGKDG